MGRTWDINLFPGYMVYQIPGTDTIPLLRVYQDPGTDSIQLLQVYQNPRTDTIHCSGYIVYNGTDTIPFGLGIPELWDGNHPLLWVYGR